MNCPSHHLFYEMKRAATASCRCACTQDVLHRNEASGALGGLTRVRQFQQDDAHIYLMESQIADEVARSSSAHEGLRRVRPRVHREVRDPRPEKRIGDDALWDKAEGALRAALEKIGLPYELKPGDGAFYGPKIDFDVTDSLGRKWQLGTIQLDYAAPERFDLTYIGDDNKEHRPVVIHRAIYGSFERFIAILIEHYAGNFPVWLAPVQARVLPVAERLDAWGAGGRRRGSRAEGFRVEIDRSSDKLGAMIRDAAAREDPVRARRRRQGGRGEGASRRDATAARTSRRCRSTRSSS